MTTFIQLHLLTAYPAANLNRDDTGAPKTVVLGGATRLRVSSQSLKRAWRTSALFEQALAGHIGIRSGRIAREAATILIEKGIEEKKAIEWAAKIADYLGKAKNDKKPKDPLTNAETEQLVHISPAEFDAVKALAHQLAEEKRAPKEEDLALLRKDRMAVDIAMFGRMLANKPEFNVEAACQVWQKPGVRLWSDADQTRSRGVTFVPLSPIPLKDRTSMIFLQYGQIDVLDGAFVLIDKTGIRTHIPVGSVACIMLEPGTRVSHAAVHLAATVGTLLVWVGEAGVRVYSSGQPGGARADKLLYQAKLALTEDLRLKVVRKMYELRFREPPPARRSVEQLRGIEGSRVRQTYALLAKQYGVKWNGRKYDPKDWEKGDVVNRCISAATSCLYGISEAAVLAAGYAPAIGFIHSGKPLSFVYDIADIIKFDSVVPKAFEIAARQPAEPDKEVRLACRDIFRSTKLTGKLIPLIEEVLAAGEIEPPQPAPDMLPPAIPEPETLGDSGHRGRGG